MTAADKPRADLVALLLQFEACAPTGAWLNIAGDDAADAVRAWADLRGHHVQHVHHKSGVAGKTISYSTYTVAGAPSPYLPQWEVRCRLSDDHEVTAPADQQVLARVQAALDGEHPTCPECDGPADHCPDCGAPNGQRCTPGCSKEQPEAAEGSV